MNKMIKLMTASVLVAGALTACNANDTAMDRDDNMLRNTTMNGDRDFINDNGDRDLGLFDTNGDRDLGLFDDNDNRDFDSVNNGDNDRYRNVRFGDNDTVRDYDFVNNDHIYRDRGFGMMNDEYRDRNTAMEDRTDRGLLRNAPMERERDMLRRTAANRNRTDTYGFYNTGAAGGNYTDYGRYNGVNRYTAFGKDGYPNNGRMNTAGANRMTNDADRNMNNMTNRGMVD